MKKIVLSIFVMCLTISMSFSQNSKITLPDGVSSYAFVLDKNELVPIPQDNLIISTFYNVKGNFEIYGCNDPSDWTYIGNIDFTKFGDIKKLKTKAKIKGKMKNFRYFCIDYKEDQLDYEVFSYQDDILVKAKKKGVLIIDNKIIDKGFYVLDYSEIEVDDYIKIINSTSKINFKIKTYVFDFDQEIWRYVGDQTLLGYGYVDTIENDIDAEDYKIIALVSENKMDFTCKASEKHSDLYIEIYDLNGESNSTSNLLNSDIEESLKTLKKLYDNGYIDDEEYKLKKSQILGL